MPFLNFGDRRRRERIAHQLYVTVIEQSRQPHFYIRQGVPDSLDGRFDLIVLHAVLAMRRLKRVAEPEAGRAEELSQALFDLMFADMDQNLRELGVSDMSVGKRVKQMARAFYGRASAYDDGLEGRGGLEEALARNLYGTVDGKVEPAWTVAMADYIRRSEAVLAGCADADLLEGRIAFALPEALP